MSDKLELQREAEIEIVGTQYEGRAVNHIGLTIGQQLEMKHCKDNIYDRNAVGIFTKDGKDLGFLSKGYASLYAPAIDSGRYIFSVEIVKTSPDTRRPILIVKIISDFIGASEEDVEKNVFHLIDSIAYSYSQKLKDYLQFILSDSIDISEVMTVLYSVRMFQRMLSVSKGFIENYVTEDGSEDELPCDVEALKKVISDLRAYIAEVLKKIQRATIETYDNDDDDEYYKLQGELRSRRKKFKSYENLCSAYIEKLESFSAESVSVIPSTSVTENEPHEQFVPAAVEKNTDSSSLEAPADVQSLTNSNNTDESIVKPFQAEIAEDNDDQELPESVTEDTNEESSPQLLHLTDSSFREWLVREGGIDIETARTYIKNIHYIEWIYIKLSGTKRTLLRDISTDQAETMIRTVIQSDEYAETNNIKHNGFDAALEKYLLFTGFDVGILKNSEKKRAQMSKLTFPDSKSYKAEIAEDNDYDQKLPESGTEDPNEESSPQLLHRILHLTDSNFREWLAREGGIGRETARTYAQNIHHIERIYGKLSGTKRTLLGDISADEAETMIRYVIQTDEYAEANSIKHNGFNAALEKYLLFAGFDVSILKNREKKRAYMSKLTFSDPKSYKTETTDIESCAARIPDMAYSFSLNGRRYSVNGWIGLYNEFLCQLYFDREYNEALKGLIGKKLFDNRIDFADTLLSDQLHRKINITTDFFAEGMLSDSDIIKRIKYLMELCSISNDKLVIEYKMPCEVEEENSADSEVSEPTSVESENEDKKTVADQLADVLEKVADKRSEESVSEKDRFTPNTTKPFVLKNAVVEILSSNTAEINSRREHNGGISPSVLRVLIKNYYGKNIAPFEMMTLLLKDKSFKFVGKQCYILNESALTQSSILSIPQNKPYDERTALLVHREEPKEPAAYTSPQFDVYREEKQDNQTLLDNILEVIRENSGGFQYADGFGAYEVKNLLANKGITSASEDEIENLMSECLELDEIDDGYYVLSEKDAETPSLETAESIFIDNQTVAEKHETVTSYESSKEDTASSRRIVLKLNGNLIRTYDYSDALRKVCEFAINCKPFKMARIAGCGILLNGENAFYRKSVPVIGYNKLSNELQVIAVDNINDLRYLTEEIRTYCQIDEDLIQVVSV